MLFNTAQAATVRGCWCVLPNASSMACSETYLQFCVRLRCCAVQTVVDPYYAQLVVSAAALLALLLLCVGAVSCLLHPAG